MQGHPRHLTADRSRNALRHGETARVEADLSCRSSHSTKRRRRWEECAGRVLTSVSPLRETMTDHDSARPLLSDTAALARSVALPTPPDWRRATVPWWRPFPGLGPWLPRGCSRD